jgi:hypothetical protein
VDAAVAEIAGAGVIGVEVFPNRGRLAAHCAHTLLLIALLIMRLGALLE